MTPVPRHVVLVGLSGSGKSTVGKLLAEALDRPFVDTDKLVESGTGASIPDIFREKGETTFRAIETRAVEQAVAGRPAVIATGGGAPVAQHNRELLWTGNLVVWLDAPVSALVERVGATGNGRPLLESDGGAGARLAALLAQREPVYAQAHVRIDTAERAPNAIVEEILKRVKAEQA